MNHLRLARAVTEPLRAGGDWPGTARRAALELNRRDRRHVRRAHRAFLQAFDAALLALSVTACSAPVRGPATERPPPPPPPPVEEPRTAAPPARDPFAHDVVPPPPAGAECTVDEHCTLQSYPDPDRDGCCPHWCGRPVVSVAFAMEAEKKNKERCRDDCPPYDCAYFSDATPRCDAGRCVAAKGPRR